jgi:hypothetical protein
VETARVDHSCSAIGSEEEYMPSSPAEIKWEGIYLQSWPLLYVGGLPLPLGLAGVKPGRKKKV